ncbi:unnamed protein product [Amoebophrya sp. A25]|nr:unnamed protein product [Amoebophrya sp. A25]|eukprot:GSA25T00018116001.1
MRGGARGFGRAAWRYAKARNEHCSSWAREFNRGFTGQGNFGFGGGAFGAQNRGFASAAFGMIPPIGEVMPPNGFVEQHAVSNLQQAAGAELSASISGEAESELATAIAEALNSLLSHGAGPLCPIGSSTSICEGSMTFNTCVVGYRCCCDILVEILRSRCEVWDALHNLVLKIEIRWNY